MKLTKNAIWEESGFLVKREANRTTLFEDLNPQVSFSLLFTRMDNLKLALFFLYQAVRR